jgi:hypothetical protein
MNPDESQFPKGIPSLVDILNSGKEPKATTKGIPTLKEMLDEGK